VPVGDYYENTVHQLCRGCYGDVLESKGEEALKGMKKVRDCSSVHKHEFPGRQPRRLVSAEVVTRLLFTLNVFQIMSEKEQKKLQYREAYMSLYYS
jgi:hypothetical protein